MTGWGSSLPCKDGIERFFQRVVAESFILADERPSLKTVQAAVRLHRVQRAYSWRRVLSEGAVFQRRAACHEALAGYKYSVISCRCKTFQDIP